MLTLFHSPRSRSTRILALIEEMGIADRIDMRLVTIPRVDGSGARDAANPHPEGKVPALLHDGALITETAAIMVHLTTLFPEAGLAPAVGTPQWGEYLTWMAWYAGVMEPVMICQAAGIEHPYLQASLRGVPEAVARVRAALDRGPWLLGDSFTAADMIVHSPWAWFREATPDDPVIRDWVDRCMARPGATKAAAREAEMA